MRSKKRTGRARGILGRRPDRAAASERSSFPRWVHAYDGETYYAVASALFMYGRTRHMGVPEGKASRRAFAEGVALLDELRRGVRRGAHAKAEAADRRFRLAQQLDGRDTGRATRALVVATRALDLGCVDLWGEPSGVGYEAPTVDAPADLVFALRRAIFDLDIALHGRRAADRLARERSVARKRTQVDQDTARKKVEERADREQRKKQRERRRRMTHVERARDDLLVAARALGYAGDTKESALDAVRNALARYDALRAPEVAMKRRKDGATEAVAALDEPETQ